MPCLKIKEQYFKSVRLMAGRSHFLYPSFLSLHFQTITNEQEPHAFGSKDYKYHNAPEIPFGDHLIGFVQLEILFGDLLIGFMVLSIHFVNHLICLVQLTILNDLMIFGRDHLFRLFLLAILFDDLLTIFDELTTHLVFIFFSVFIWQSTIFHDPH